MGLFNIILISKEDQRNFLYWTIKAENSSVTDSLHMDYRKSLQQLYNHITTCRREMFGETPADEHWLYWIDDVGDQIYLDVIPGRESFKQDLVAMMHARHYNGYVLYSVPKPKPRRKMKYLRFRKRSIWNRVKHFFTIVFCFGSCMSNHHRRNYRTL